MQDELYARGDGLGSDHPDKYNRTVESFRLSKRVDDRRARLTCLYVLLESITWNRIYTGTYEHEKDMHTYTYVHYWSKKYGTICSEYL